MKPFEKINTGYNTVFNPNQLTIGLVVPIENYSNNAVPTMVNHLKRIQQIEQLGFKAIWLRDIPFNVPSFGDAGQTFDPFTYLGYIAGKTTKIALGIASIALPLHHPAHIAKSVATIDQLSDGRMLLGVASGDRYDEYPAMNIAFENRGELFRESFEYIRKAANDFPVINTNFFGNLKGDISILPKPTTHKIPMLITGFSQQTLEWNAEYGDGWMSYPKDIYQQRKMIALWRNLVEEKQDYNKPFMQPLYIDLQTNADYKPQPIHLGFRIGLNYLLEYLHQIQDIGVNHIALNLRFNTMQIDETLVELSSKVLPQFHNTINEEILI